MIETLIKFFKKSEIESKREIPHGYCPNCWGKQAWDGEFYEFTKGSKNEKRDETYNNFINKIAESNINGIAIQKDTYTCKTCHIKHTQN